MTFTGPLKMVQPASIFCLVSLDLTYFVSLADDIPVVRQQARRSHSIGNINMSMREKIEKPIEFETSEAQSPPRKVLKVPKNLREEVNGRTPPRTSTPSSDHNVSVSPYEIISMSSVEKSSEEKSEAKEVRVWRGSLNELG